MCLPKIDQIVGFHLCVIFLHRFFLENNFENRVSHEFVFNSKSFKTDVLPKKISQKSFAKPDLIVSFGMAVVTF